MFPGHAGAACAVPAIARVTAPTGGAAGMRVEAVMEGGICT